MQEFDTRLLRLQLFADGGDGGGDGGSAGEGATPEAASPESRLEALGVPKDKIRKRAKPQEPVAVQAPAPTQDAAETEPAEPADVAEEAPAEEVKPARMSWEEIMADPEYNKQMQATIQKRLKESKAAQETLDKLAPALEMLGAAYQVDVSDIDGLVKAVQTDDKLYEERAMEMGVSADVARRIDEMERFETRRKQEEEQTLERQKIQQHLVTLEQQGAELKKTFPTFDLGAELQNPTFRRLTAPNSGLSVADAYYAIHRAEIQAATTKVVAEKTAQKMSNSIQSGKNRPIENGAQSQAPSVSTIDYKNMSKDQREAFKRRIREASARGDKIYPGSR